MGQGANQNGAHPESVPSSRPLRRPGVPARSQLARKIPGFGPAASTGDRRDGYTAVSYADLSGVANCADAGGVDQYRWESGQGFGKGSVLLHPRIGCRWDCHSCLAVSIHRGSPKHVCGLRAFGGCGWSDGYRPCSRREGVGAWSGRAGCRVIRARPCGVQRRRVCVRQRVSVDSNRGRENQRRPHRTYSHHGWKPSFGDLCRHRRDLVRVCAGS